MSKKFTIVIPFLRGRRDLDTVVPCVRSCLAQEEWAEEMEIRVVANTHEPALADALSFLGGEEAGVFVDCVGDVGVNRARNLGAARARGEFVFFLDDDCLLPDGILSRIYADFSAHPELSVVGGPYRSPRGASWKTRGYNAMARSWALLGAQPLPANPGLQIVHNLLGGNSCYRRDIFAGGQFFSEEIVSGGDEAEFHKRLRSLGHTLAYGDHLSVLHIADDSWRGASWRAWRQGDARTSFGLRSPLSRRARLRHLFSFVREEPGALPFVLLHFPLLYLSAYAPKLPGAVGQVRDREQRKNPRGEREACVGKSQ